MRQTNRIKAHGALTVNPNKSLNNQLYMVPAKKDQEGQHPLTGQRSANFRLLANQ